MACLIIIILYNHAVFMSQDYFQRYDDSRKVPEPDEAGTIVAETDTDRGR